MSPSPCWLAACAVLALSQDRLQTSDDGWKRELDRIGRGALAGDARGLALAIDVRGETVFAAGWGVSDPARATPADAEASFRVGPLLGCFLGTAALRLAARGELELDSPLARVLPGLYPVEPGLTVERLLTHTSGIPPYDDFVESRGHLAAPFDPSAVLGWLAGAPLEFAPGTCASYSDTDDFLLGLVLEKAGETPLPELLEREVFAPAGMEDTQWCFERPLLRAVAPLDREFAGDVQTLGGAAPPFDAEGLCSTALDLLRFQRALDGGQLLPEPWLERRAAAAVLAGGELAPVGCGVNRTQLDDIPRLSAGGGMAGYRAHLAHYPTFGATLAVLACGSEVPADEVERAAARVLFDLAARELSDLALSPEERALYTGEYYAASTSYGITTAGARLVLVTPDGERHELLYQGDGRFVARDDHDLSLEFEFEEARTIAFVLTQRGVSLRAVRVG